MTPTILIQCILPLVNDKVYFLSSLPYAPDKTKTIKHTGSTLDD